MPQSAILTIFYIGDRLQKTLALHIAYSFSKEKVFQVCTVSWFLSWPWMSLIPSTFLLFKDSGLYTCGVNSLPCRVSYFVILPSRRTSKIVVSILFTITRSSHSFNFRRVSFSVVEFLSSSSIWRIRLSSFDISCVEYWTEEQTTWCGFLKRKIDVDICRNHKLLFYQGVFK